MSDTSNLFQFSYVVVPVDDVGATNGAHAASSTWAQRCCRIASRCGSAC